MDRRWGMMGKSMEFRGKICWKITVTVSGLLWVESDAGAIGTAKFFEVVRDQHKPNTWEIIIVVGQQKSTKKKQVSDKTTLLEFWGDEILALLLRDYHYSRGNFPLGSFAPQVIFHDRPSDVHDKELLKTTGRNLLLGNIMKYPFSGFSGVLDMLEVCPEYGNPPNNKLTVGKCEEFCC